MSEKSEIKAIFKNKYAKQLNISIDVLRKYLNVVFISDLEKLNY